jgi:hypothetical protein
VASVVLEQMHSHRGLLQSVNSVWADLLPVVVVVELQVRQVLVEVAVAVMVVEVQIVQELQEQQTLVVAVAVLLTLAAHTLEVMAAAA